MVIWYYPPPQKWAGTICEITNGERWVFRFKEGNFEFGKTKQVPTEVKNFFGAPFKGSGQKHHLIRVIFNAKKITNKIEW